ncbi:MAG: rhodanese-like domain-containing protein [bacterium]|nr:rhodanese-like domain-containing protein [bacterium]
MQWNDVMTHNVKLISPVEAREYCRNHPTESYQLVDVRQPGEYEQGHIPGSVLIPLDQVVASQVDLDKSKPTLVYCHAGRRSAAAAQHMAQMGFTELYDVQGGYSSWVGLSAAGPVAHNLNLIGADAEYPDALAMSYAMESGLQAFYHKLAEKVDKPEFKTLLERLASFEDHHKENLISKGGKGEFAEIPADYQGIMEGGFKIDELAQQVLPRMTSNEEVFSLAMAIEAQAFDFYTRLSEQASKDDSKKLFMEMADEEKKHLGLLAGEMDQILAAQA